MARAEYKDVVGDRSKKLPEKGANGRRLGKKGNKTEKKNEKK